MDHKRDLNFAVTDTIMPMFAEYSCRGQSGSDVPDTASHPTARILFRQRPWHCLEAYCLVSLCKQLLAGDVLVQTLFS